MSIPVKLTENDLNEMSNIKQNFLHIVNEATNEIDTYIELESNDNFVLPQQHGLPSLKKTLHEQNVDIANTCNDEDNLLQSINLVIHQESEISNHKNKTNMMLRSTNQQTIKMKWDEIKTLKSHNDLSNGLEIDRNAYSMSIKKTRNPKNTYDKNVKIKIPEQLIQLSTHYNDSLLSNNSSNIFENTNLSNSNISTTQSLHSALTTNNIPLIETIAINNNDMAESANINFKTINRPYTTETSHFIELTVDNNVISQLVNETINTDEMYHTENTGLTEVSVLPDTSSLLSTFKPISESSNISIPTTNTESSEISYGMTILSEAISRQCKESSNSNIKRKLSEANNLNEISMVKAKNNSQLQVPSAGILPKRVHKNMLRKVVKHPSKLCKPLLGPELPTHVERILSVISQRFGIPIDSLRNIVVLDPLAVINNNYSTSSITPSMLTVSPIVNNTMSKNMNINYLNRNLDVEYKIEPIRECAAYEKTNLKDLVQDLTKTLPSWSISIVTNPNRFVITQMSIDMYGVPTAKKCIVLDRYFRASVYINQCLEFKYSKRYLTAIDIINLIQELNSL